MRKKKKKKLEILKDATKTDLATIFPHSLYTRVFF